MDTFAAISKASVMFWAVNKWYHCDDKHITETNLLRLSNNVYLMFYAKEVDLGT